MRSDWVTFHFVRGYGNLESSILTSFPADGCCCFKQDNLQEEHPVPWNRGRRVAVHARCLWGQHIKILQVPPGECIECSRNRFHEWKNGKSFKFSTARTTGKRINGFGRDKPEASEQKSVPEAACCWFMHQWTKDAVSCTICKPISRSFSF